MLLLKEMKTELQRLSMEEACRGEREVSGPGRAGPRAH